ncbi:MAG: undecaprenyl/decaprenyl-phosphate alpha-N-acetylglucosaminyl 1-phosphate transferase [Candidatus Omnitrophica bacterium]|jgi:UDP-GlcNAc:undecaprenyl-phosphate GlcNAc-1-phosphate transferase|nr:undecaprenyl/decaprenyl-phosphate alpha-N-acetylglucosaminyl 1-phosphate transferase [Candidatus Omnitrophota bacterium]
MLLGVCIFASGLLFTLSLTLFLSRLASRGSSLRASDGVLASGGIAIAAGFFATAEAYLVLGNSYPKMQFLIMASLAMFIFGLLDDVHEFSVGLKFLSQIIACSIAVAGGIKTEIVYIGPWVNIIITYIWVLGITNAFNHLDVLDGVTAGTTVFISAGFLVISLFTGQPIVTVIAASLLACASGFFIFNFPPARIYMGNSGSHFLGFVLSLTALMIDYAPMQRKIALISPLLLLGLPIFDSAFLIWVRLKQGRSIVKKSGDHFCLRLLQKIPSKKKTLFLMLGLALFFVSCGVITSRFSNLAGLLVIILCLGVSIPIMWLMAKVKVDA